MNRYFGLHTLEGEWHSLLPRYLLLADRVVGRRILDIGCGTGIGSSLLLELGAEHVDAIDYRPAVLEVARMKHAKPGLDFHVMFWEELDFDDHSFDMVICLDPSSPVTDRNLLLEMRRVLKPGGEYICAVERKNLLGMESMLPRYGYADVGEKIDRDAHHERVPQLGALSSFFETIASVTQQPHLSYIFDSNPDINSAHNPDVPPDDEMRKVSTSGDSGLWTGPARISADNKSVEHSDNDAPESSERWITMDRRFCLQRDEAGVEILFCGDSYMAPAPVREVSLPYYPLVDRFQEMSSALQSRSHGNLLGDAGFGPLSDDGMFPSSEMVPSSNEFSERDSTSEYRNLNEWEDQQNTSVSYAQQNLSYASQPVDAPYGYDTAPHTDHYASTHSTYRQHYSERATAPVSADLNDIHSQLAHVGNLYEQVRGQLEDLVFDTRRELAERDRYIAHLVGTVHHWEKHFQESQHPTQETDRERTGIFTKSEIKNPNAHIEQSQMSDAHNVSDDDHEPKTTIFSVSDIDLDDVEKPAPINELQDLESSDLSKTDNKSKDFNDTPASNAQNQASTTQDDPEEKEEEEEEHSL